jgi:hypothetical protein
MMRARDYEILRRAVEEGIARGWTRAHKHTETPTPEEVQDMIESAILDEICEWFEFPPSPSLEG